MANYYKWVIPAIDYKPVDGDFTDVVSTVHWRYGCSNIDDSTDPTYVYVDHYGSNNFDSPVNSESFIPFDQLTKDVIISWLEGAMDINELNDIVDKKLNDIIDPVTATKVDPFGI